MVRIEVDDPALAHAINDSREAYADGDPRFFEYLDDDVRVYNLNSIEPMVGRKTFEEAFLPTFDRKLRIEVVESDVRTYDRQAVHAQTVEITMDGVTLIARQTVVWERKDAWKVSHIHMTLVGQPLTTLDKRPTSARAVRVLNERIATVAACVGVAQ